MDRKFRGVLGVTITPFDSDGALVMGRLLDLVDFMIGEGVHGLIVNGSTGEFASMNESERNSITESVVKHVSGQVPVLVGCSANSTADVIRYCRHAEKAGADGIMLVHPFYCLPTEDELYEHYVRVDREIGIPVMIYNNPFTSGIDMQPSQFCRIVENTRNIRYFKESSSDIRRVHEIIRMCGSEVTVFNGWDDIVFESFVLGAEGWVAGTANIIPKECVELYSLACEKKDLDGARALYYRMLELLTMVESEGKFVQYIKAGLKMLGRDCGIPRPPMLPPSPEDEVRLKRAIAMARGQ